MDALLETILESDWALILIAILLIIAILIEIFQK